MEWNYNFDSFRKASNSSAKNTIFGQYVNKEIWHINIDKIEIQLGQISRAFYPQRTASLVTTVLDAESDNVLLIVQAIVPSIVEILRLMFPVFEFVFQSEDTTDAEIDDDGAIEKAKSRIDVTIYAREK